MAANAGRDVVLTWNSAALTGVRETGISVSGEAIDITDTSSDGRRELLDETARDEVNISVSGVAKNNVLKTDWYARTRLRTLALTYPNGDSISGSFYMNSFSETEPYEDAETFSAEFISSGEVVFTAA